MFRLGLIGGCACRIDEVPHRSQGRSLPGEGFHAVLFQRVHNHGFHIVAAVLKTIVFVSATFQNDSARISLAVLHLIEPSIICYHGKAN